MRMQRFRARLGLTRGLVGALVLLTTVFCWVSEASADDGQNMVQVNMWGNHGATATYNPDVAGEVLGQLVITGGTGVSPGVWGASLNEICYPQWVSLWNNYFATRDFQAQPFVAKASVAGGCGSFMNVAAVRGSSLTLNHGQAFATQGNSSSNGEYKGFICIQSNYYGQVVCSAHTQSGGPSPADTQLWEYNTYINPYAVNATPLLESGDFNMSPGQGGQLSGWNYPVLLEADASGPGSKRSTTDDGYAIDYIFRRAPNSRSSTARIKNLDASDHHLYVMHL